MIDAIIGNRGRSAFIETAVRSYIEQQQRVIRDRNDLKILGEHAARLNKEALDVLSYQVEL